MRSAAASPPPPTPPEGLAPLDRELLLAEVLGVTRAQLHLAPRAPTRRESARFEALCARRRAGEPVAYLLGRRAFRWIELEVDRRVLIPRPETEGLVEAALALPPGARVADVGTGSGAVALALKQERPDLAVVGMDVSEDALTVASANGRRLGLDVEWVLADLLDGRRFDAVLSNPPYVEDDAALPVDVAEHEPALALRGGPDGLDVIRRLVPAAFAAAPFLAVEIGAGQADAVRALCRDAGFTRVDVRRDLAGIERIVVAERD